MRGFRAVLLALAVFTAAEVRAQSAEDLARADVCHALVDAATDDLDRLTSTIRIQRSMFEADIAAQEQRENERPWLDHLFGAILGNPVGTRPPRVLAELNQSLGEQECLARVVESCRPVIAATVGAAATDVRGTDAYRTAFRAHAVALARVYQATADDHWDMAQQRKQMFNASPFDYRLATEANRFVGISTACRSVAATLGAMQPPQIAPEQPPEPAGVAEECRAALAANPYFCQVMPMNDGYDAWLALARRCCTGFE